jgi:hypothetical protein
MKERDYSAAGRSLLGLFVVEVGVATILFGLYKAGSLGGALATPKFAAIVAFGACVCALGPLAIVRPALPGRRTLSLALVANLVSVTITFAVLEATLRLLARPSIEGITVAGVAIRPTWSELVQQIRDTPPRDQTYFTYDAELGWVVGANRQSADGRYFSSAEGIRSSGAGVVYADMPAKVRVALIGDSNAFSLEVPFEDSWGYHLEQLLGGDVQVLNFGVDGYGIDQMYLRYLRDVRPWKPRVVVIGFIQHDLIRSMAVYPFITFGWPRYVTKPRFDLIDDKLAIVNAPLQQPEAIAQAVAPADLPYIDYDPGFVNQDWKWRFDGGPMLMRLLTSLSPRWPEGHALGAADTVMLNDRLLHELIAAIESDGAVAVLTYLPRWVGDNDLAHETLNRAQLPYLDMTECLRKVPEDRRHVPSGAHLTGEGNTAIAACTEPSVRCGLGDCR